jgi:hypothetical protein
MFLDYNFILYLLANTSLAHCKHYDRGSQFTAKKTKACHLSIKYETLPTEELFCDAYNKAFNNRQLAETFLIIV